MAAPIMYSSYPGKTLTSEILFDRSVRGRDSITSGNRPVVRVVLGRTGSSRANCSSDARTSHPYRLDEKKITQIPPRLPTQ